MTRWVVVAACSAYALPSQACFDHAARALLPGVQSERTGFLLASQSETHEEAVRGACVGFIVAGEGRTLTLDLVVRSATGVELGADRTARRWAYVRICDAPSTLHWTVRSAGGRGRYHALVLRNPTRGVPDLARVVGGCFAPDPGVRAATVDVGLPPPGRTAEAHLGDWAASLRERGYVSRTPMLRGTAGQPGRWRLPVSAGRCQALLASRTDGGGQVELALLASDGRHVAGERGAPVASLRFCSVGSETLTVVVQSERPAALAFMAFELSAEDPAGLAGGAVHYAELRGWWSRRGFALRPRQWVHLRRGEAFELPVTLEGRCAVFAASPSEELPTGDVDVELLDAVGRHISADRGPEASASVVACRERGPHRLRIRLRRGEGRVLISGSEP